MTSKTETAVNLFNSGKKKEALSIFSRFKVGFTKEELRTLQIAHESMAGHSSFYQQIGIDTEKEIRKAELIVSKRYN